MWVFEVSRKGDEGMSGLIDEIDDRGTYSTAEEAFFFLSFV